MALVRLDYELSVSDTTGIGLADTRQVRFPVGISNYGKRETVSLTGSAFTALSPPTSAKFVMLLVGSAASLTLKGVTGDTGIAITPASPNGIPVILPLGSSPSIGITNGGSTVTIDVIWL